MGLSFSRETTSQEEVKEEREQDSSTRNRKRSRDDDDDDHHLATEEEGPSRKRRRVGRFESIYRRATVFFVKVYFYFTEKARTEDRSFEAEYLDIICYFLDNLQHMEREILQRGWRVLCSFHSHQAVRKPTISPLDEDIVHILTAMKLYKDNLRIQLLGCRALRTLLLEQNMGSGWKDLCDAGGISVFADALDKFQDDIILQGLIISFMGMLVRELNHDRRQQLVRQGAVPAILRALHRHQDNYQLVYTAIFTIQQISFMENAQLDIFENNGVEIILDIIQKHHKDAFLVDLCLAGLRKLVLADGNGGHWQRAIPVILDCMEFHPDDQSVLCHCLMCLIRLIDRLPVPNRRLIELIVAALTTHKNSPSLVFFSCATLRELLNPDQANDSLDMFSRIGGIEALTNAVRLHSDAVGIRSIAVLLLLRLFVNQQQQEQLGLGFGGGETTISIMTALLVEMDDFQMN